MARARGPGWVPRPSGCSSRRCTNSGFPYPVPEAPHSPGSRAGPGAAAPCGHALFTSASALALPLVAVSACALRTSRSDSAKNNKSLPPAARRRLPSTDTASGIARRSASPPRPRDGHAPSDHAPVAHASSLTKTTPSLAARRTTPLMATPLAAPVPGSSYMLPRAVVSLLSSWPCPSPTHPGRGLCSFPKVGGVRRA